MITRSIVMSDYHWAGFKLWLATHCPDDHAGGKRVRVAFGDVMTMARGAWESNESEVALFVSDHWATTPVIQHLEITMKCRGRIIPFMFLTYEGESGLLEMTLEQAATNTRAQRDVLPGLWHAAASPDDVLFLD